MGQTPVLIPMLTPTAFTMVAAVSMMAARNVAVMLVRIAAQRPMGRGGASGRRPPAEGQRSQ